MTFDPRLQAVLGEEKERREQLQTQLSELTAAHNSLRSKVAELEEGNAVLQRENEELHSAALPPGPSYRSGFIAVLQDICSTPPTAPHTVPLVHLPCMRKSVVMATSLTELCNHP